MRKSLFFAGLAAAALTLVGCNKEADFAGKGRKVEIVLSDVATRTINSGMSTEWNAGDELSVFNAEAGTTTWSSNIKFTVQDASANRAAGEVELTADAYDWYAFYPYTAQIPNPTTINPETSKPSGYTTVGGKSQIQREDDNMDHLAGKKVPVFGNVKNVPVGEIPAIEMKNAAAVVRFKVTNSQAEEIHILSVKFTAPEDIVGTYYIDFSGTAPSFVGSGESYVYDNVTVTNSTPVDLAPDSNSEFYAVIKPFTAEAGSKLKLEIEAENVDGSKKGTTTKEITLTADAEFKAGCIKTLTVPFDATMASVAAKELPYSEVFKGVGIGDFTIENVTIPSALSYVWTYDSRYGMKASAFLSGTAYATESWLISPKINLSSATTPQLSFKHAVNQFASIDKAKEEATVWVREENGTWTKLEGVNYPSSLGWAFVESGAIDLSAYVGKKILVGFKYTSTEEKSGTWEVQDFLVQDAAVPEFGVDQTSFEVAANATSVTVNVTGNVNWTVQDASEGVTATPASGSGTGTITVSFPANTDPTPKAYALKVVTDNAALVDAGEEEFVIDITQAAASTEAEAYPFEEHFTKDQGKFTIDNVSLGEGLTTVWKQAKYNSDTYMKASAYVSANIPSESWLISPWVDMASATAPALTFRHCVSKFFGDVTQEATVWIKEEGGSWNQLTITYPSVTSGNFSAFEGVSVDVSAYAGKKVQVGFKYVSTSDNAGTWEVTDVKLDEAVTGPVDPELTVSPSISVDKGKTATISVTTNSDGEKTWSTSDATVATVANGVVTGVNPGSATITLSIAATANYNAISATIPVTVNEVQTASHYGKVNTITSGKKYLIAGGNQPRVMVPPTGTGNLRPESAPVTINAGKIVSDETTNAYAVTINKNGDDVSIVLPNGNYLVYSNNSTNLKGSATETDTWTVSEGEHGVFRMIVKSTASAQTVRGLVYRGGDSKIFGAYSIANVSGEEYFDIDLYELGAEPTVVSDVVLASIDVTGQTTDFTVGDTFTFDGVVTATYSDGSTKNVTSSAEITPPDLTTAGTKNVTVSYTEKEVTKTKVYQVTVSSGSSSGDKVIIIDGSKLTSDATTADTDKTYDGVTVTFSKGAKALDCPSTATNNITSKAIMIGKKGTYIYNKTAIPGKIVKFEVYANKNASTAVTVGINFSDSALSAYNASAANTYTATLSPDDSVFDCSDKLPANAKYFWFQVTNDKNSQVQFRITYE